MRLTRQTNYAIRILMYLATNEGRLSKLGDVARSYAAPEPFMFKILQPLVASGLVETVRGRNGGIRLGREAGSISLREVVELMEESFAMAECFDGGTTDCPLVVHCELNAALRQALEAFLTTLGQFSIADLVENRPFISQTLGIAPVAERAALS
ncbi:iron-responsive transcriptional regulator RirA [Jiella sp. MQZ9-1]|uniref:Iron-responsive transcriptional regulator RirA n=1 Tax=Jiella flava TaxID=2816857 RepID=A0A939G1L0_9HYPH|nr:iron-responsive transcriptional regulator RirA [Jiella flava]MBO0663359.1 iron-responsive transcriptional regulator RirA [Jiella flava]MCD2471935.1 iron-responsive transcriptional regulator RirA [Jiella flava]